MKPPGSNQPVDGSASAQNYSRRKFLKGTGTALAGYGLFSILGRSTARAAESMPPNILLVFPDQLRRDWNALNPDLAVRTPNLARLAREGTRFERAYCPTPLCAPSRACLAQGKEYGRTGVLTNKANNPDGVETFYQHLREAGYRVGALGKADLRKHAFDWGPDGLHRVDGRIYFREWGFTDGFDSEGKPAVVKGVKKQRSRGLPLNPYAGFLNARGDGSLETYLAWYKEWSSHDRENRDYAFTTPYHIADEAYIDSWVGANALNLIEKEFPADQPWFLQINFPGPHDPEDITPRMAEWYRGSSFPQPIVNDQYPPEVHVRIRRNYSAMVENIDRWLGRYLAALEKRGELERTLVIFSSDHGEMLGDHNCWGKSVPFEASSGVPLVVRGPGVARGRTYSSVMTTLDLPATFLDYAGRPVPKTMDSRSLRPLLAGNRQGARSYITSALEGWRMVCDDRFKLVDGIDLSSTHGYDGLLTGHRLKEIAATPVQTAPQLFDLRADPNELENVADRHPEIVARLQALLPPPRFRKPHRKIET